MVVGGGKRALLLLLLLLSLSMAVALAEDLYEVLGVSASASQAQMKRAYRRQSLKFHPDKQTPETKEEMKEQFVKISNAYRVLSDPERREKYDLYGIADEQGFQNFDDAFRYSHEGVEDSVSNWLGLVAVIAVGVVPIVVMQRNRTKPVRKRREAVRSLARNKLTAAADSKFNKSFSKARKEYASDPTRAHHD